MNDFSSALSNFSKEIIWKVVCFRKCYLIPSISFFFFFLFFPFSLPLSLCFYLKNTWQHNCIRESLEIIKGNFQPTTAKGETKKNLNFIALKEIPFALEKEPRQRHTSEICLPEDTLWCLHKIRTDRESSLEWSSVKNKQAQFYHRWIGWRRLKWINQRWLLTYWWLKFPE